MPSNRKIVKKRNRNLKTLNSIKKTNVRKAPLDYLTSIRLMFKQLQYLKSFINYRKTTTTDHNTKRNKLRTPFTLLNYEKTELTKLTDSRLDLNSQYFDIFVCYESDVCTARSIFNEIWDKKIWKNVKTYKDTQKLKLKIVKHVLFVMTNLDIYLFKHLLMQNVNRFPGIDNVIDERKKLICYLIVLMKKQNEIVDTLIEILQLWYVIQPVVLESMKYTKGIITDELKQILTDVDALYDWISNVKKDCPPNIICSVSSNILPQF